MTAAYGNGTQTGTTMDIVQPMHALSVAKFGTQTINTTAQNIGWGTPTAAADVIAQVEAGKVTEFARCRRSDHVIRPAPGCRVFFNGANTTKFNNNAWTLFDRAAAYTSMSCGKNMLWTGQ